MHGRLTLGAQGCHAEPLLEESHIIGEFMLKCEGLLCSGTWSKMESQGL